jgi:circadian clock protein KaiC
MTKQANENGFERAATGITGFDEILGGGFPRNRLYLVEGEPGAGKTTLGFQFLMEGARNGEPGIYVTLSEGEGERAARDRELAPVVARRYLDL